MNETGTIYILAHSSGTTIKVGETTGSAEGRLKDYSSVYDLKGFAVHKKFAVPIETRRDNEARTHQILAPYQLSGIAGAREIFSCTPAQGVLAVEKALAENSKYKNYATQKRKKQLRLEREQLELRQREERFQKAWQESPERIRQIRLCKRHELMCQSIKTASGGGTRL